MRKIHIVRKSGYYGKLRALKLIIDGRKSDSVKDGESIEIQVPDNAAKLKGKMDWASTHLFSLENIKGGEAVIFEPYFTFNPLRHLGLLALPVRISLQHK